ncbi:hypothetical protein XELAEV_18030701mg [Xenopus laevis]|uniref:Uncharacterized protein n=1 Tax=Xenopus laevis TaxID=8355 RepID=A0A974CL85_XENLA|nr:hypothetical protein XELAEV_18030701mg [Xenopus laevis]
MPEEDQTTLLMLFYLDDFFSCLSKSNIKRVPCSSSDVFYRLYHKEKGTLLILLFERQEKSHLSRAEQCQKSSMFFMIQLGENIIRTGNSSDIALPR